MLKLSVRFAINCAESELAQYLDALEEALKRWNDRRPTTEKLWCDAAVGNTHNPPLKKGGHIPGAVQRFAEVSANVRVEHPLYNINLAHTALIELVLTFDSVLNEHNLAPDFPEAVCQHGFTVWRRGKDMQVGPFEQAA